MIMYSGNYVRSIPSCSQHSWEYSQSRMIEEYQLSWFIIILPSPLFHSLLNEFFINLFFTSCSIFHSSDSLKYREMGSHSFVQSSLRVFIVQYDSCLMSAGR